MIDFARAQREYLDTVKGDILNDLNSRGMNATGNLKASLRVVENQHFRAQLRAADYLPLVVSFNRRPYPSSPSFWKNIVIWMKARRIRPRRNDGRISGTTATDYQRAAYGIATKITRTGTKYQRPQSARGVDLQAHLRDNLPDYLKGISKELLTSFKDRL